MSNILNSHSSSRRVNFNYSAISVEFVHIQKLEDIDSPISSCSGIQIEPNRKVMLALNRNRRNFRYIKLLIISLDGDVLRKMHTVGSKIFLSRPSLKNFLIEKQIHYSQL